MDFHEISIGISNNVQRVFIGFTWDVRGILIGFPLLCACDVRTHDGQVHISTILRQIPFLTIARVGKSEKIMLKRERGVNVANTNLCLPTTARELAMFHGVPRHVDFQKKI